jgi:excisionase family DNA binding protein
MYLCTALIYIKEVVAMTHDELIAEGLVSLEEAMRFLSISRPTLNRLLNQGVLPTVRLVTTRRIPRKALLDFAARSVEEPVALVGR